MPIHQKTEVGFGVNFSCDVISNHKCSGDRSHPRTKSMINIKIYGEFTMFLKPNV